MTIITAVVVVIVGSAICTVILISMKNMDAKFDKSKYVLLSELGSRFNLSFSSHLVLHNKLMALDGLNRMLLVLETNNQLKQPYIIDLNKINAVSIKKIYGSIGPGALRYKKMDEFLRRIDLQFEYRDKNEFAVLVFYDSETDNRSDLPRVERNAKNWQMILSKLVVPNRDKINAEQNSLRVV